MKEMCCAMCMDEGKHAPWMMVADPREVAQSGMNAAHPLRALMRGCRGRQERRRASQPYV